MKLRARLLILALCALAYPAAAIDFTPRYLTYFIGDTVKRRLYFLDEKQKIGLKISADAQVDAFEGGARIRFPGVPDATYLLRNSPMKAPFDAANLPKYREIALRFAPASAKGVQVSQEVADPLTMFDWTSHRYVLAFTIGPRRAQQEVTFLNVKPDQQVVLIATAYEDSFAEFTQRTYNVIRSWNPLQPRDEVPEPFN